MASGTVSGIQHRARAVEEVQTLRPVSSLYTSFGFLFLFTRQHQVIELHAVYTSELKELAGA